MKTALNVLMSAIVATSVSCSNGVDEPSVGIGSVDLSRSCQWKVVNSPNVGMSDNSLAAVAGEAESDVWAVGSMVPDNNPDITNTLIQHFDGSKWSVVGSPNVGTQANALNGVTQQSDRVFAVGFYIDDHQFTTRSLIEAWDGRRWHVASHPQPGASDLLSAVSAVSPTDVWAVGFQTDGVGAFRTLTEHFDGSDWSVVPSPDPGSVGNQLYGVVALSSTNVWAVGGRVDGQAPDRALILHWTGNGWSELTSPEDGSLSTNLFAVSAASSSSVAQAAGDAHNNRSGSRVLVEDGSGHWKVVSAPSVGSGDNHLYAIAVPSTSLGWAVGSFMDASGSMETLILSGSTSGWSRVPSPSTTGDSVLGGVAVVGQNDVWAVGAFDGANSLQTLVEHCH